MKKIAIYNHGKESEPWGSKALALAKIAEQHGYSVQSPDYRAQSDPDERVRQLLTMDFSEYQEIVLIGSSMGAYVATVAAEKLQPAGLFLLAPAFYLPGYQQTQFYPPANKTLVIHGWQDDIVNPEHAWRFCQQYQIRLNMLDADHRLLSEMPKITQTFDLFLSEIGNL